MSRLRVSGDEKLIAKLPERMMVVKEGMFCGKDAAENARMEQYFATLPAYVQETLHQSGTQVCSMEELKQCAQTMTKSSDGSCGSNSTQG